MTIQELEEIVGRWLLLKDEYLVRVVVASAIANRLDGDPLWVMLVGPPSSAKSELITALHMLPYIYPLSDITPQTFVSGKVGRRDESLLMRLPSGTILTYKDFTTVLEMRCDKRAAILSQLREIYDGRYSKSFGTGQETRWKGKLGLIAGVTPVVDRHYAVFNVLGERFVMYRLIPSDPKKVARKAEENSGAESPMREAISQAFHDYLAHIEIPRTQDIIIPLTIKEKIINLACYCVRGRSGIIRDRWSREIEYIPEPEAPPRLTKQLMLFARGLACCRCVREVSEDDYKITYKLAMDTLPLVRKRTMDALLENHAPVPSATVSSRIGYPLNSTSRFLEDLHALGLIDRHVQESGRAFLWKVSDETRSLLGQL